MDELIKYLNSYKYMYDGFLPGVLEYFHKHPTLNEKHSPIIHSIKSRIKDESHIQDKIERKQRKGVEVSKENIFNEITDYIGVRVIHLHQKQFESIHNAIIEQIDKGEWKFKEDPKAITWDPESKQYYESLQIKTEYRETHYTSVHYVIQPNNESTIVSCEIQVRTLFEEIWGEIDHAINYPHPTDHIPTKEQLKVLSKLVATGTKLADSIFITHNDSLDS